MKQDAGGRKLVGSHRPDGEGIEHHEGFHRALDHALDNHDWEQGEHEATVHLAAVVGPSTEGAIHEYIVTVSRPG